MNFDTVGRLIREGSNDNLMAKTFDTFQKMVFPEASEAQINALRISFFAGATELFTAITCGLESDDGVTTNDLEFVANIAKELVEFSKKHSGD